jgi:hypothetical protein
MSFGNEQVVAAETLEEKFFRQARKALTDA